MKRSSVVAAVVLFVALGAVGGGLAAYKIRAIRSDAANQQAFEPPQAVQVVPAKQIEFVPMADLVGSVISLRSVMVSNELPGTITSVQFDSGAIVEQGQVLLTLDDSADRADLAAMEANVRVAEANLGVVDARVWLAETEAGRLRSAVQDRAASEIELDRATAELDKAKADRIRLLAEIDLAKARVSQVQTRLAKMVIKAPFRARAGLRRMHEGQYLAEGAEVVAMEEIADTIYLDFAVPQEYLARVRPGTSVMATSDLLGPNPVRIEVAAVDATVNSATRNVRVRAVVDNRDDRLRPGMFIQIRVPVEAAEMRVVVPTTAVRRTPYADQVFLVAPGETPGELRAKQRFVTLGPTIGDQVIVLKGLEPGDQVAANGSFKLRDGALVTVPAPATASSTDAAATRPAEPGGDGSGQAKR